MPTAKPKDQGDPNYGATVTVADKGSYLVEFKVAIDKDEPKEFSGVHFDVD